MSEDEPVSHRIYEDTHAEVYVTVQDVRETIRVWWRRRHETTISWTPAYIRAMIRLDINKLRAMYASPPEEHVVK